MKTTKPTVCLNMIVKNESAVIIRCLDSVKNLIDYWVISDTGSTDNTQNIISDYFQHHKISGLLTEDKWINFAHNRNIALNHARDKADYILLMDADDYLVTTPNFQLHPLHADCYQLHLRHDSLSYFNIKLIRTALPWRWEGVLHEYIECNIPYSLENWRDNCHIASPREGARSRNPNKYQDDAAVLAKALETEPNNARYRFYLAQSHRDYGNYRQAIENYKKRAEMQGWEEEGWYALFQTALLKESTNYSDIDIIQTYLAAHERRPQRAESLYNLARYLREHNRYALAYVYAKTAAIIPLPNDVLFVANSVYEWQAKDELAVSSYWIGNYQECITLCDQLLSQPSLPENARNRIQDNMRHAANKLAEQ